MFRLPKPLARLAAAALAVSALPGAPANAQTQEAQSERPALGVFTTMPLTWGEAPDIGTLLAGGVPPHWARAEIERTYEWRPLDILGQPESGFGLDDIDVLLLAQSRGLSGAENVALDNWVRAGGRVLVLADPMMTGDSLYNFGDRRRPHDVTLLSPILARWGLAMQFDEADSPRTLSADFDGTPVPVALPGHLVSREAAGGGQADCVIAEDRISARCEIGAGSATVFADAALLDYAALPDVGRLAALDALLDRAFAPD